jgi:hypothetical protein
MGLEGWVARFSAESDYRSAAPVRTLTVSRSGSAWSARGFPALPDGDYTVQAEQSDTRGHTGLSPAVSFRIEAAALLSFFTTETTEPSVIGWMPAAAVLLPRSRRASH